MDIAAPLGEWADGARTLVICPPGSLDRLVRLAGLAADEVVTVTSLDEAFPALCRERFVAVLLALPLDGETLAAAVGELRIVRQGPAIVVVGDVTDRAAALARGASGFVPRASLGEAALRECLRLGTAPTARVGRLVRHVVHQRRVVDSLLEGVLICSPSDRVLYMNERAAEILGRPQEELLFKPFPFEELELADEDGNPLAHGDLASQTALRTGRPVEVVVQRMRRRDGELRWVEVFASLLAEPPGAAPYAVVACFRDVTEERVAQAAHLAAERRRRQLLEHATDGYLVVGEDLAVREASPSIERFWPPAAIMGADATTLFHPADRGAVHRALADARPAGKGTRHLELRLAPPGPDAATDDDRWVEATVTAVPGDPVVPGDAVVVNLSEATARIRAERARRFAEERFRLGFEHGTVGMTITDLDGRILEVNPALCELFGMPAGDLVGTMVADRVHPDDAAQRLVQRRRMFAGEIDRYRSERRYLRPDGTTVWCLLNVSLIRDDDGLPLYLFSQFQDITERKSHEAVLEHRVHHDVLTGLPNRRGLQLRLEGALDRAAAAGTKVAVLFLDVDRFKIVNDGLGHAAGDVILVETARRLAAGVRDGDTVARFGGDEFIVVCERVDDLEEADLLARRTTRLFERPFDVDGKPIFVSASCGIVLVDGTTTAEEALRDADAAMYEAKDRGRGRRQVFDERLRRVAAVRLDTEQALRLALDRQELRVVYQPVLALGDGGAVGTVGVEALVRWDHPERGTLPPAEFIPAAEASGLILGIGAFVLQEALAQVSRWRISVSPTLWVAVNLSPRQLALGNPVAMCQRALDAQGAAPDALRLELTESALMEDVDTSVRTLEELRDLGVTMAIDDFGTGYSSLAYLSRLPVDILKIDRSFVAGIGIDPHASEIVRTVTSLARAMDLETCAEGVERPDQLSVVTRLGCGLAQGFLWSPPLPHHELGEFLVAERAATSVVESTG